jgi:molybdopterin converting factor small subunit
MRVTVELQAYLQQYSPNGKDVFEIDLPEGATVQTLINKLEVPDELANVIIVGNTNAGYDHPLAEGDRVTLIPPLAGGATGPPSALRRAAAPRPANTILIRNGGHR